MATKSVIAGRACPVGKGLVNLLNGRKNRQKFREKCDRIKCLEAGVSFLILSARSRVRHINNNLHDCRMEKSELW